MDRQILIRIRIIAVFLLVSTLITSYQLYRLQVVEGNSFSRRGESQYARPANTLAHRGNIFFKAKNGTLISAAMTARGYSLTIGSAAASSTKDASSYAALIDFLKKEEGVAVSESKDGPGEKIVARRIPKEDLEKIKKFNAPGLELYEDFWREYPSDTMASHALGFVGYEGDKVLGRYGVERYYNDALEAKSDHGFVNLFAEIFGDSLFSGDEKSKIGDDLALTIEPTAQNFLERKLDGLMEKWKAKSTGGIIVNPRTGELYAMAARPSFDPNFFQKETNPAIFSNPLVENVYEMGSIIKALTMSAGLETKAITAQTTYFDNGSIEIDKAQIFNFDKKGRGKVDMQEVLNHSLYTGAAFVAQKVGKEKFVEYMQKFGLGEETGIDLPGETYGLIDNLKSPRSIEYITASFGQGIALTPIATVRALSALANGGVPTTPHITKEIREPGGVAKKITFPPAERVISEKTSEEISRMRVRVVDEALLNGAVKLPHYSIAAKTGTAQIAKPSSKGYYDDRFMHTFFGYFPAYDPRFLIFLYLEEPKGERYAAYTLTEPFMETTKFLLNYYEVAPDR